MTGAGSSEAFQASESRDRAQQAFLVGAAHATGIDPAATFIHLRPDLTAMSDQQLDERIGRIHVLLAAAYDEQQRRGRTRSQRMQAERAAWNAAAHAAGCPLDASDVWDGDAWMPARPSTR